MRIWTVRVEETDVGWNAEGATRLRRDLGTRAVENIILSSLQTPGDGVSDEGGRTKSY